jgi:hypothetical protein
MNDTWASLKLDQLNALEAPPSNEGRSNEIEIDLVPDNE